LLINQVKGSLDKQLLEKGMFEPNLSEDNLNVVVFSAIDILKFEAKSYGVSLLKSESDATSSKIVMIDKIRVQQILINLIHNSIKFSKSEDKILVSMDQFVVDDPQNYMGINIRVTDQGIGISSEDR
jgi:signal transduction histidine kinase